MKLLIIIIIILIFLCCFMLFMLRFSLKKNSGTMTSLARKEFSCSHWNRDILSTFAPCIIVHSLSLLFATVTTFRESYAGMKLLLRIPRYVTKLEGCHWLVGPRFKLLVRSMTAVMTPDHLTLHFPSGSGIPAVTLRCYSYGVTVEFFKNLYTL